MVELSRTYATVIGCFASPGALDALDATAGSYRVAPDESMIVGTPSSANTAFARAAEGLASTDDDALVLDTSDGWAIWTLSGSDAHDAFARLSPLDPAVGYASGDVARVPTRIVAQAGRIHLLVPAMWTEYLRERILTDCRGLHVKERSEPVEWELVS